MEIKKTGEIEETKKKLEGENGEFMMNRKKGGGGYPLLDPTRVTVDQATLLVQVCRPSCNTPQSSVFCPADPSLGGEDWKKEQALIV